MFNNIDHNEINQYSVDDKKEFNGRPKWSHFNIRLVTL